MRVLIHEDRMPHIHLKMNTSDNYVIEIKNLVVSIKKKIILKPYLFQKKNMQKNSALKN